MAYLLSLLDAMTRSQSLTLCFFRYFFVKYLRYLHKPPSPWEKQETKVESKLAIQGVH